MSSGWENKEGYNLEALIRLLDDKNNTIRINAAYQLGESCNTLAVESLIQHFPDKYTPENIKFLESLIISLGKLGDPRAVEPLLLLLSRNVQTEPIKKLSIQTLKQQWPDLAIETLLKWLEGNESTKKLQAIILLGQLGSDKVVNQLVSQLENDQVADKAARSLAELGAEQAVNPIIQLARSKHREGFELFQMAYNLIKLDPIANGRIIKPLFELLKSTKNNHIKHLILQNFDTILNREDLPALRELQEDTTAVFLNDLANNSTQKNQIGFDAPYVSSIATKLVEQIESGIPGKWPVKLR